MYIAYHIDDDREQSVPIATGSTRSEAMGLGAKRVLMKNIIFGRIGVQVANLTADEFAKLTEFLNDYFKDVP